MSSLALPSSFEYLCYVSTAIILCYFSRVVVSTAAFHARVRSSVPGFGGLKETKMFLPHPRVKVSPEIIYIFNISG